MPSVSVPKRQNPFPLVLVKNELGAVLESLNETSKPLLIPKIVVCLLLEALKIHVIGRCYVSAVSIHKNQKNWNWARNCYLDMKHKTLLENTFPLQLPPFCHKKGFWRFINAGNTEIGFWKPLLLAKFAENDPLNGLQSMHEGWEIDPPIPCPIEDHSLFMGFGVLC